MLMWAIEELFSENIYLFTADERWGEEQRATTTAADDVYPSVRCPTIIIMDDGGT